jgi:hypothetical protein
MFRHAVLPGIFLSALTAAHAQQQCTPIHFALGDIALDASTATFRGTARSDPPFACYTLTTGPRQTATVGILQRSKGDIAFNIEGLVDSRDSYTFKTEAKTYKIDVYRTFARRPDQPFTMQVSVK